MSAPENPHSPALVLNGWKIIGMGPLAQGHEFTAQTGLSLFHAEEFRTVCIRTHWLLCTRPIPGVEWRQRLEEMEK